MKFFETTRCCFCVSNLKFAGSILGVLSLVSIVRSIYGATTGDIILLGIAAVAWSFWIYGIFSVCCGIDWFSALHKILYRFPFDPYFYFIFIFQIETYAIHDTGFDFITVWHISHGDHINCPSDCGLILHRFA